MAHFFVVPELPNTVLTYGGPVTALGLGRWRARLIGGALFVQYVCDRLFPSDWHAHRLRGGARVLTADLLEFALCVFCLYRAKRYWVVWTGGLMLVAAASDALYVLFPGTISLMTFGSESRLWAYLLSAVLIWGAITENRDARAATGR